MADIASGIISLLTTLLAVVLLGIVAGFSPTLFITQATVDVKSTKKISPYTIGLVVGVALAIVLLIVLFQFIQPGVLRHFFNTTVRTIVISVIFNGIVGLLLIAGGAWYLTHRNVATKRSGRHTLKKTGGVSAMFSFGFFRTLTSVSGIAATFLAGTIIANSSVHFIEQLLYTLLFLAAAITPFGGIAILMRREDKKVTRTVEYINKQLDRFNYKTVLGIGAVILGCCIVLANVLTLIL